MNTSQIHRSAVALLAFSILASAGCSGSCDAPSVPLSAPTTPTTPTNSAHDTAMLLDGEFSEWSSTNSAFADARFLNISFSPKSDDLAAIQAAPYTTRIRIDTDLDA